MPGRKSWLRLNWVSSPVKVRSDGVSPLVGVKEALPLRTKQKGMLPLRERRQDVPLPV